MANTQLSKSEQNALSVSYDVLGEHVELDIDFVKKYLVRGQADKITNQEIVFFMNTCKMQKLNPLVSGEVYCIKFGSEPAQMVVGKGAYMRRAFEHPDYLGKEDGITVIRGEQVVMKEGTCIYPKETLIGGWCRVHYKRGGGTYTAFKEVSLDEYNKGQANWKTKPATMINKVAISQCVRDAFPKDYEGLYSEDEMVASGAIPSTFETVNENTGEVVAVVDRVITQEEKQEMYSLIQQLYGTDKDTDNNMYLRVMNELGLKSTVGMTISQLELAKQKLTEWANEVVIDVPEEGQTETAE